MLFILSLCVSIAFAKINFDPAVIDLGTLIQGQTKTIKVKITNTSDSIIEITDSIAQGTGPKDLKVSQSLGPKQSGELEFTYNSEWVRGAIYENISIIDQEDSIHSLIVQGLVKETFLFSNPQIDLGFVAEGEEKKIVVYAWSIIKPQAGLNIQNAQGLLIKITPTTLDISNPEKIIEGGSVKGYKINLTYKATGLKKSIRKLIAFSSGEFPMAHPEIHLIGYKKP
jgi:hypothetical protein